MQTQAATILPYVVSFLAVSLIAFVHLIVPRLRVTLLDESLWLHASAGVAVSYVFVDILPHLASYHDTLATTPAGSFEFLEHHTYVLSLFGFVAFLGVYLASEHQRSERDVVALGFKEAPASIRTTVLAVVAYNFLIGDLVGQLSNQTAEPIILFALVMAIHLLGVDLLVRGKFTRVYDGFVRVGSIVALYCGWLTALVIPLSAEARALAFAFLAGAIIVATVVQELPHIRTKAQYAAFCVGALVLTVLILVFENLKY